MLSLIHIYAMSLESFEDGWDSHISNICNMATNGSCVFTFLDRARELNPDFAFLEQNTQYIK